jgi:hypothetical protein
MQYDTIQTIHTTIESPIPEQCSTRYEKKNPGEREAFRTCPDRLWGPLSLLYNGYRVFLGGRMRPGRDADPSPPSCDEA